MNLARLHIVVIALLIVCAPQLALAHAGHGHIPPNIPLHWFEAEHFVVWPIALLTGAVAYFVLSKRAQA